MTYDIYMDLLNTYNENDMYMLCLYCKNAYFISKSSPFPLFRTYYCLMKRKNLAWRPLQGQVRGSSLFYLELWR